MRSARRKQSTSQRKRLRCRIGEDGLRCDLSEQQGERKIRNESVEPGCYVDLAQKVWHCPHIPALHGRQVDSVVNYQTDKKFGQGWAWVGEKKVPVAAFPVAVGRRASSRGAKMKTKKNPLTSFLSRFGFGRSERILPRTSSYPPCKVLKCPPGQHCKCTSQLGGGETCQCVADYTALPGRQVGGRRFAGPGGRSAGPGTQYPVMTSVPPTARLTEVPPTATLQTNPGRPRTTPFLRRANPSILLPALNKPGKKARSVHEVTHMATQHNNQGLAGGQQASGQHCVLVGHFFKNSPYHTWPPPPIPSTAVDVRDSVWNVGTDICGEHPCPSGYHLRYYLYRDGVFAGTRVKSWCQKTGSSQPPPWDPNRFVDPSTPVDPPFPAPGGGQAMAMVPGTQAGVHCVSTGTYKKYGLNKKWPPPPYPASAIKLYEGTGVWEEGGPWPCDFECPPGYYISYYDYDDKHVGIGRWHYKIAVYCLKQGSSQPPPWDPNRFADPSTPVDPPFPAPGGGRLSSGGRTPLGAFMRRGNPQHAGVDPAFVMTPRGPTDPGSFIPLPPGPTDSGFQPGDDCCYDADEGRLSCPSIPEIDGVTVQIVTEFTYQDGRRGVSVTLPSGEGIRVPICRPSSDTPPPEFCCVDTQTMMIVCLTPSHPWHGVDVSTTGNCYVDENGDGQCEITIGGDTYVLRVCDGEPDDDPGEEPDPVTCCYLKSTNQIVCEDTTHQWHLLEPPAGTVTTGMRNGVEYAYISVSGDDHVQMPVCPEEDPEEVPFDCCYLKSTRQIVCADEGHAWHRLHVPDEMVEITVNGDGSETARVMIPGTDPVTMIVCPEPEVDCPPGTRLDEHGNCVPPPPKKKPKGFCPPLRRRKSTWQPKKKACCDGCASGEKKCCGDKH